MDDREARYQPRVESASPSPERRRTSSTHTAIHVASATQPRTPEQRSNSAANRPPSVVYSSRASHHSRASHRLQRYEEIESPAIAEELQQHSVKFEPRSVDMAGLNSPIILNHMRSPTPPLQDKGKRRERSRSRDRTNQRAGPSSQHHRTTSGAHRGSYESTNSYRTAHE